MMLMVQSLQFSAGLKTVEGSKDSKDSPSAEIAFRLSSARKSCTVFTDTTEP